MTGERPGKLCFAFSAMNLLTSEYPDSEFAASAITIDTCVGSSYPPSTSELKLTTSDSI